jgi:hypothetical protein
MRALRQNVVPKLPILQIGRTVGGNIAERIVRVAILAKPVVKIADFNDASAVCMDNISRRIRKLCPVGYSYRRGTGDAGRLPAKTQAKDQRKEERYDVRGIA